MARVSWLVPVYNAAPYLEAALRSIASQTFTDFEVIVVDDGSTDRSLEIIRDFCAKDTRFRSFHQENSGIITTLNNGLQHCSGEFVARMDGDDISEPNRLETQVAFMDARPECVAAGTRTTIIDEAGRFIRNSAATVWKQPGPTGFPRPAVTLTHPSIIVRTEVLRGVGGYRHEFLAAEDYDLLFRLARAGKLTEINERLLRYRVHSKSESATKIGQQRLSCLKAEVMDYLFDLNAEPELVRRILKSSTAEELCEAAGCAGHGVPDARSLRLYYLAELLRRATYRLSRTEAMAIARETFMQSLRTIPRLASATSRHFFFKAAKELLRWLVVSISGRNGPRATRLKVSESKQ